MMLARTSHAQTGRPLGSGDHAWHRQRGTWYWPGLRTLSEPDNWLGGLWASQLALTARRKEMAAERVERLDPQVALLRGIHDSAVRDDEAASGERETV